MKRILFTIISLIVIFTGCFYNKEESINNIDKPLHENTSDTLKKENTFTENEQQTKNSDVQQGYEAIVEHVYDGDTMLIRLKNDSSLGKKDTTIKTRLLQVDTPESVRPNTKVQKYGKEAAERTKELLLGKIVYLEYEHNNTFDKYDRLLTYVLYDGKLVQEILLEEGLGIIRYTNGHTRYIEQLKKAEEKAKQNKIGVWSIDGYVENGTYNMD